MEEDLKFNRFIKDALEERDAFAPPVRGASWFRWSLPALMAASFAAVAIFQSTFSQNANQRVDDTIQLLSLADGIEVEGDSTAELLLAWQDAPCRE